jgi:hypothetical protein
MLTWPNVAGTLAMIAAIDSIFVTCSFFWYISIKDDRKFARSFYHSSYEPDPNKIDWQNVALAFFIFFAAIFAFCVLVDIGIGLVALAITAWYVYLIVISILIVIITITSIIYKYLAETHTYDLRQVYRRKH